MTVRPAEQTSATVTPIVRIERATGFATPVNRAPLSYLNHQGSADRMIKLTARATAVPERAGNSGHWPMSQYARPDCPLASHKVRVCRRTTILLHRSSDHAGQEIDRIARSSVEKSTAGPHLT